MPTTIPYDASITLGNIVDPKKLEVLEKISEKKAPIDMAENKMNDLISFKRSIDSTIRELGSMGVDTNELYEDSQKIGEQIKEAAKEYAQTKLNANTEILEIKAAPLVHANWESPLDYNRTEIKRMPLSADSMNMNVQYFSCDQNSQSAQTQSENIQSFISSEFKFLGDDFSHQASAAAARQINSQYSRHDISGTLEGTKEENAMTIVSGATYGSCFVGMVHILNNSITRSSEEMNSLAQSIQAQCKMASWFADVSGGFGLGEQFAKDIKNMFSSQNVTSHCTITTKGAIPSIKANSVKLAVKEFTKFDGASAMDQLASLQNATSGDKASVDKSAESARLGQQMVSLQNAKIQGVLTGLSDIDDGENKILDINSMMTALEDYINKALSGELGMPINYYLKPITKAQLAQLWVNKYFPDKFLKVTSAEGEE